MPPPPPPFHAPRPDHETSSNPPSSRLDDERMKNDEETRSGHLPGPESPSLKRQARSSQDDAGAPTQAPAKRIRVRASAAKIVRQCVNCGSRKSPQWRSGPEEWGKDALSALCNTCGVK